MEKGELEKLIETKREKFLNKNIVAFVGDIRSGKSVVASIMNYHLVNEWIPKPQNKWGYSPVAGDEHFYEIVRKMQDGFYSGSTLNEEFPSLIIEIISEQGISSSKQLTLYDLSGEQFLTLLGKGDLSEDDRLFEILSSPGDYLAFANHYVIIVGCDTYDYWKLDNLKVGRMIRSLQKIKKRIHHLDEKEKLHIPISVVFTKTDLLKPEIRKKSPEELLKDYPSLANSLNTHHDSNKLACFKVYVNSILETKEQAKKRIGLVNEKKLQSFKIQKKAQKEQYETLVNLALTEQIEEFEENSKEELPKEERDKLLMTAKTNAQKQYQYLLNLDPPKLEIIKDDNLPSYRVTKPFKYSTAEYSRLISWIITENYD